MTSLWFPSSWPRWTWRPGLTWSGRRPTASRRSPCLWPRRTPSPRTTVRTNGGPRAHRKQEGARLTLSLSRGGAVLRGLGGPGPLPLPAGPGRPHLEGGRPGGGRRPRPHRPPRPLHPRRPIAPHAATGGAVIQDSYRYYILYKYIYIHVMRYI